jgi:hypothetical protein
MFFGTPKNIPDVFFGSGSRFPFTVQGFKFNVPRSPVRRVWLLQSTERRTLNAEPLNCEPER